MKDIKRLFFHLKTLLMLTTCSMSISIEVWVSDFSCSRGQGTHDIWHFDDGKSDDDF